MNTATANFTPSVANSPQDIVTAPGPGAGSNSIVKIFNGKTGALMDSFAAYPASYTGGINVAVGDVNDDGIPDIIVAPMGGVEPVEIFNGKNVASGGAVPLMNSFYPYGSSYLSGVSVAAGDFYGNGYADVVTSPQGDMVDQVNVYNGDSLDSLSSVPVMINQFIGFPATFTGGANVAVGDVDGDGTPDIVLVAGFGGAGAGLAANVEAYSGASVIATSSTTGKPNTNIQILSGFQVFASAATNPNAPLNISLQNVFGDGRYEAFIGQGANGEANVVNVYRTISGQLLASIPVTVGTSAGVTLG